MADTDHDASGHRSRLCPAFGTHQVLIGCPCNDVQLDDNGVVTFAQDVMNAMPKVYDQAHVDRLTGEIERLREGLRYVIARARNGTERGDSHDSPISWRLALVAVDEHSGAVLAPHSDQGCSDDA
jgi:hypothetical protein